MQQINRYIDQDLIRQAQFLHVLTQSLRLRLPVTVRAHCWAGGIRDNTLVVITDSANWAVPIRYQQYELLKQLNTEFQQNLKRVKIKVTNIAYQRKKPANRPSISLQSAQHLASTASTMQDSELKSALLRLSKRCKPQR
ncbi:MAG: DciA family protein [Pseudomonadota bacterium]